MSRKHIRNGLSVMLAIALALTAMGALMMPETAEAELVTCTACNGSGKVVCGTCHGSGFKNCSACGGTGGRVENVLTGYRIDPITNIMTPTYTMQKVNCTHCGGSGHSGSCSTCNGTKQVNCGRCNGTGKCDSSQNPEPEPDEPDEPDWPAADENALAQQKEQIPDAALRTYLKEKYDTNGDNFLSEEERNAVTYIDAAERGIASMQGIELFPNMDSLYCDKNRLTSLNVSGLLKLGIVWCDGNKLTELIANNNPELYYLKCTDNSLEKLDVSKLAKLRYLHVSGNSLTELDVSKNTVLRGLECSKNKLTKLDLSGNKTLGHLKCENNKLTALDVSNNPEVYDLYCSYNQIEKLDVTMLPALQTLEFSGNKVQVIDLSQNTNLSQLVCHGNQLAGLNTSHNRIKTFGANDNKRGVEFKDNKLDLSTLEGFEIERARDFNGGKVEGTIVTLDEGSNQVSYVYNCHDWMNITIVLTAGSTLAGDVNGDYVADGRDAVHLMKYLAGETDENGEKIQINEKNADLNKDGKVDEKDLLQMVKSFGGEKAE